MTNAPQHAGKDVCHGGSGVLHKVVFLKAHLESVINTQESKTRLEHKKLLAEQGDRRILEANWQGHKRQR